MCEPASIIAVTSLAIGAASSVYAYQQSNQQANQAASLAQQSYDLERQQQTDIYNAQVKQQQIEYDRQAADASLQYQRAMQQRASQVDAQTAQYQQLSRQSQAASSTSAARAAEAGVGGLSVDALMSDYWRQELDSRLALDTERNAIDMQASNNYYDYKTGSERNQDDYLTNSKNQYAAYKYGYESNNIGLQNQMLKINDARTSSAQLGLNLASSAVSSADTYYRLKTPKATDSRLPKASSNLKYTPAKLG